MIEVCQQILSNFLGLEFVHRHQFRVSGSPALLLPSVTRNKFEERRGGRANIFAWKEDIWVFFKIDR